MQRFIQKLTGRERRHRRIRAKVVGTADRPRLTVFRSAKHTTVQVIDDTAGTTIAMASDLDVKTKVEGAQRNVAIAQEIGKIVAERVIAKGVHSIVFDRGGYAYHGRVQAIAEGARAGGLAF